MKNQKRHLSKKKLVKLLMNNNLAEEIRTLIPGYYEAMKEISNRIKPKI